MKKRWLNTLGRSTLRNLLSSMSTTTKVSEPQPDGSLKNSEVCTPFYTTIDVIDYELNLQQIPYCTADGMSNEVFLIVRDRDSMLKMRIMLLGPQDYHDERWEDIRDRYREFVRSFHSESEPESDFGIPEL